MRERGRLDSVARRPQTVPAPAVFLTIEEDHGGQAMAAVVRIVFEELRETPQGGDENIR